MKTTLRILTLLGTTLGSLFMLAVFAGNTVPQCAPIPIDSNPCITAADCDQYAHIQCLGEWQCVAGECQFDCGQPDGCYADEDCGEGAHCSVSDGECLAPPGCADCTVCYGACVPDEPEPEPCYSDEECAADQFCDFTDCVYPDEPGDPDVPIYRCAMPPCQGVCKDKETEGECGTDGDCGPGFQCQIDVYCTGAVPPGQEPGDDKDTCVEFGTCVPAEGECLEDADCGPGYQCKLIEIAPPCGPGELCTMEAMAYGVCEPAAQAECWMDEDCGPNQYCDFSDCGYLEGAEPCIACMGVCRDNGGEGECGSDIDCGPGARCEIQTICEEWDCYGDDCGGGCFEYGMCVPDDQCQTDADCGPGASCEATTLCIDGLCGDFKCGGCYEINVCTPDINPVECYTDDECGANQYCDFSQCGYLDGAEPCMACLGICRDEDVPGPPPPECAYDHECDEGEVCVQTEICGDDPANPYGSGCFVTATCEPSYAPPEGECEQDADCASDEICVMMGICVDGPCDEDGDCYGGCFEVGVCQPGL